MSFNNSSINSFNQNKNNLSQTFNFYLNTNKDKNEVLETFVKMSSRYNHLGKSYLHQYLNNDSTTQKNKSLTVSDSFSSSQYNKDNKEKIISSHKQARDINGNLIFDPVFAKIPFIKDGVNTSSHEVRI